jgi:hypothetical protein
MLYTSRSLGTSTPFCRLEPTEGRNSLDVQNLGLGFATRLQKMPSHSPLSIPCVEFLSFSMHLTRRPLNHFYHITRSPSSIWNNPFTSCHLGNLLRFEFHKSPTQRRPALHICWALMMYVPYYPPLNVFPNLIRLTCLMDFANWGELNYMIFQAFITFSHTFDPNKETWSLTMHQFRSGA